MNIAGIGKLAKAIPEKAWTKVVDTACNTFSQLIAPVTSVTGGIGRLIHAKFDRLVDAEKVLAAENMAKAHEKSNKSRKRSKNNPKPSFIIKFVDESSSETDTTLRELWTNLLANELIDGNVHPEFIRIMSRLSVGDAHRLADIAEREKGKASFIIFLLDQLVAEPTHFTDEHLKNLGLIIRRKEHWKLTETGKAFIRAASDPSIEEA